MAAATIPEIYRAEFAEGAENAVDGVELKIVTNVALTPSYNFKTVS
jgi:hypothetical protein